MNDINGTENATNKVRTTVMFSPDVLDLARRNARSDRRSMSNYLEWLIWRDLRSKTKGKKPKQAAASPDADSKSHISTKI